MPAVRAAEGSSVARGLALGCLAGVMAGLFGIGGGAVLVPLLVLLMGVDQHRAHATSLAAIIITAISGTVAFALDGEVAYTAGALIAAGAIVGAGAGARVMHRLSAARLRAAFGVFMIVAALQLLLDLDLPGGATGPLGGPPMAAAALLLGLVAGGLSAVMGVGGGVIMVPAMVLLFDFSQHLAEGTSLLIIIPTALVGAATHARQGYTDWRLGFVLGVGGLVGAQAGSAVALALDAEVLQRLFGGFLLLMSARMLRRARPAQRPGEPALPGGDSTA